MHRITVTVNVDIDLDRYRLEYGGSDDELADLSEAHDHAEDLVLSGARIALTPLGWATVSAATLPVFGQPKGYELEGPRCPAGCRLNNVGDCVHTIQARAKAKNTR